MHYQFVQGLDCLFGHQGCFMDAMGGHWLAVLDVEQRNVNNSLSGMQRRLLCKASACHVFSTVAGS
jgi:hypothetical protein